jgi:hypothetical protein
MSPATRVRWSHAAVAAPVVLLAVMPVIAACGGAPRQAPVAGAASAPVNPQACGKPASEPGVRVQAFLVATLELEADIAGSEAALRDACGVLGRGLGLDRARTAGGAPAVCGAVAWEIHAALGAAAPAGASLGGDGSGAVSAAVSPAPTAAGAARSEATLRVVRAHLPGIVRLRERATGPLQAALHVWGRTAADLLAAGPEVLRGPGVRAGCMFDQLVRAAAHLGRMQASLTAQREASAAIHAAAGLPTG